jgi:hypothetical protein
MVQACNSSYSKGRDLKGQLRQKFSKTSSQQKSWAWWLIPVIQAMQEREAIVRRQV